MNVNVHLFLHFMFSLCKMVKQQLRLTLYTKCLKWGVFMNQFMKKWPIMLIALVCILGFQAKKAYAATTINLVKGQSYQLKTRNARYSSSSKKVATVSKKGLVKAKSKGTTTVKAKTNKKTETYKVVVKKTGFNVTTLRLSPKKSFTLKVLGTKNKLKWTSGYKKVATVNKKGKVTAKKAGTATITALDEKTHTAYQIKCYVAALGFKRNTIAYLGEATPLTFNGTMDLPESFTSSDPNIASVDAYGNVTGVSEGTCTISAIYKGVTYTTNVTTKHKVTLSKSKLSLGKGASEVLTIANNVYCKKVTWSSSNKKVATVNSSGNVVAKKKGTATIYAKVDDQIVNCKVTVKDGTCLSTSYVILVPKDSTTLTLKNKAKKAGKITWKSSNKKIATVSKKGKVTAKARSGKVTILAKVGKKTYKTTVRVKKAKIPNPLNVKVGTTYRLSLAGVKSKIKWTSSNKAAAKISSTGLLTPIAYGDTTITAKVNKYTVTQNIHVMDRYTVSYEPNALVFGAIKSASYFPNETFTLPSAGFTRPGYTLSGWNTKADKTGTQYALGQSVSGLSAGDVDVTLYATYTPNAGTTTASETWKQLGIAGIDSKGNLYKTSSYLTTTKYTTVSQKTYLSIDDFINYQIAYVKYNEDDLSSFVIKSGWKSSGQILEPGYKYIFMVRKVNKQTFSQDEVSGISDLMRFEDATTNMNTTAIDYGTKYVAHRGYSSKYPENTALAFEKAGQSKRFWGIETDVYNTADGQLVTIHDNSLNRTTNITSSDPNYGKAINSLTFDQIESYNIKGVNKSDAGKVYSEKVPTLSTYLSLCKKYKKHAVLEIKGLSDPKYYTQIVDEIYNAGMENDITLISFKLGYLENIKNTIPRAKDLPILCLYSNGLTDDDFTYLTHFTHAGINQKSTAVTTDQLNKAKALHLSYAIWTITSSSEAKPLVSQGSGFVTLNDEDVASEIDGELTHDTADQLTSATQTQTPSDPSTKPSSTTSQIKENESTAPVDGESA